MGLFDKKICDVCGNKIGLMGNRKFTVASGSNPLTSNPDILD